MTQAIVNRINNTAMINIATLSIPNLDEVSLPVAELFVTVTGALVGTFEVKRTKLGTFVENGAGLGTFVAKGAEVGPFDVKGTEVGACVVSCSGAAVGTLLTASSGAEVGASLIILLCC